MTEQLSLIDEAVTTSPRPIHYLGGKSRLSGQIAALIDDLAPSGGQVCDLFAGSGAMSVAIAQRRAVAAVDIQEYARAMCSALLRLESWEDAPAARLDEGPLRNTLLEAFEPLVDLELSSLLTPECHREVLSDIVEAGSPRSGLTPSTSALRAARHAVSKHLAKLDPEIQIASSLPATYGGIYFSYRQAIELAVFLHTAHGPRDAVAFAAMSAATETVSSVGSQFAQPLRLRDSAGRMKPSALSAMSSKRGVEVTPIALRRLTQLRNVATSPVGSESVRSDFREYLSSREEGFDAIYADPPYTRDHYSRFYHVLETIARRDLPQLEPPRPGMTGRAAYRNGRHQSPFCVKSQARGAFTELFRLSRRYECPVLVSYSPFPDNGRARPRLLEIDQLRSIATQYFRDVIVQPMTGVRHAKLNAARVNAEAVDGAEIVLVCIP